MASKFSLSDLDVQIEKLVERRRLLVKRSAERFAQFAIRSGVAELEMTDAQLDVIFQEIAARFHIQTKEIAPVRHQTPQSADHSLSATEARPSDI